MRVSGWQRIGEGGSWWRGPLCGVGLRLERPKALRVALPSLSCDPFVGRWSERANQMLGRTRRRPLELLLDADALLPVRVVGGEGLARCVAGGRRRRGALGHLAWV